MADKLKDDCFALPPGVNWTPVDDALAKLRETLPVVAEAVQVPVAQATGRILAAPAVATRANPPTANAAVDGYGFHSGAVADGALSLPLVEGRAAAGAPYGAALAPGSALRILTGASLPEGLDTVVLQEDVTLEEGHVQIPAGWRPGANTRPAGEDVAAGASLLPAGHRLRPQDLALLAATGIGVVSVHRPLRVAVLSTGDELVPAGEPAAPHQIYDANRPMLAALLESWGAEVVDLGRAPDNRSEILARLDAGAEADAIVTTGGASAGDEDHISAALREAGSLTHWRIAVKPGRPLALGLWRGTPAFGLPGNPVAAFVTALVFLRPALMQMAGAGWQQPAPTLLPAAFTKRKKAGRREFLRARLGPQGVEVFASEGSGRISGLSWARGLVELPDDAASITAGDLVAYTPFTAYGIA
ncbi:molybdopterin-binding protein [Algicella marina]|uniref:Molybdopterin molybdenumtransferase n=1 Tax=Algicella marina TaxID=2683284 RepID=A0A6P1T8R6_9RHOB|nr:gephyrin-like molybdotransferase Glp [Algicella marina]QHQ37012.1 molybdopterin molybdenumtransferase MoeA [Algicella marina]